MTETTDEEGAAPWGALVRLGIGQILNWGTLYYAIAVVGARMAAELEIATPVVFASYSAGLGVSGLLAPRVGRRIDEKGGRDVLVRGSLVAALAFAILALAGNAWVLAAGWIVAGIAMTFALYDPAFATIHQLFPRDFRRALTALTLLGGLASTVFWPLTHALDAAFGWRATLASFVAMHLLVGWPMHRFGLPAYQRPAAPLVAPASAAGVSVSPARGFVWLTLGFALTQFIASAMGAHVINLLVAGGISATAAVALATLIGPMQVAGRIVEFGLARRVRATRLGAASFVLLALGLVLVALAGGAPGVALAAMVLYGWGNGTVTIARGTVPAELYGRDRYGALLGRMARPQFIARAAAPFVVALALAAGDARLAHAVLIGVAAAGCVAYAVALARIGIAR